MEKIIGELKTNSKTKIIFSNRLKDNKVYGSIRKYIESPKYTGYTKQGLTLNKEQLEAIYEAIVEEAYYVNPSKKVRDELLYENFFGENGVQARVDTLSGKQYIVIQRVYLKDGEVNPGHGFAVQSILIEKLIYFIGEMLERLPELEGIQPTLAFDNQESESIPSVQTSINERVVRDLWDLHKDTQKISKLLSIERSIIREKLIELDLI